ncbi:MULTISPECIES: hypothetical protein [unclassified Halomonas]|uniref:hypothetical protein n=1 Tax=unclassified Halomonas TaxID=2609666 RepID=UPI00288639E5|nr:MULTISPECIES: hypothetical protein [unclassified Halomonas]MDT0499674.1 hypothetical protein [Halomonas sp. PAR7]MDT0510509.1 hypothetical protein [Halomonas sp. LES1]MDT0592692.1 hypothetical protein [Halomonas sp. PAR8]
MTADPIFDPRTGKMITVYELARQTGVAAHLIWHRYDTLGVRSMTLLVPRGTSIDINAERAAAYRIWRRSTAGILSTHRLGQFAQAQRQHKEAA